MMNNNNNELNALVPSLDKQTTEAKKAELLALLLKKQGFESLERKRVTAKSDDGIELPMSFAQQRMWFLHQLNPLNTAYNVPAVVQLVGELNQESLIKSLNEIIRRHKVLRTIFTTVADQPVQIIQPKLQLDCPLMDLQALDIVGQESQIASEIQAELALPFDLAQGPLLRARLLRLNSTTHIVLLTMHHIISDGWSKSILLNELVQIYQAYSQGQAPSIPELEIQYADFALWQRDYLQSTTLERLLNYWSTKLRQVPELELPTTNPRPALQSFNGQHQLFELDNYLSGEIKKISQQENCSVFMFLMAAFQILLFRYTNQTDFVVGTDIANRNRVEIENLIGFFINQLPIRANLAGDLTFLQALKQVKETTLEAYAHEDLPFEKLVEALKIERDPSRPPLYQVKLVFQNVPEVSLVMPGLVMQPIEVETNTAKFDLTLIVWEKAGTLVGSLEYNCDLFNQQFASEFLDHWKNLLNSIVDRPDQAISKLNLLYNAERELIIHTWNKTDSPYFSSAAIPEVFLAQVLQTPDAPALIYQSQVLSYLELNQRANKLAHYLQELGVGPDQPVGVALPRSPELIIALLAILKAGGAYVPVDPTYPLDRQLYIIEDAGLTVLLTEEAIADQLPLLYHMAVICLDSEFEKVQSYPNTESALSISAPNLAYIIYTSGSTGLPKGVSVTHQNVLRLVNHNNFVQLDHQQTILQLAPVSFDASVFEIWGSLLNGGRLVIFPYSITALPEIGQAIEEYGITTLWLTAGLFHQMVEYQLDSLKPLKQLLAGGDVLSPAYTAKAVETLRNCQIINGYGPTENTTFTCCHPLRAPLSSTQPVSIGSPIANTKVYILDHNYEPVPVGVPGELYAAGDGLARGYWQRSALTAENFLPDPFAQKPGSRMYRTGDLARYLADGTIEFLGRNDYQVKIRGYRIELGEIETRLIQHPAIKECVVVAHDDNPLASNNNDKQLIAYLIFDEEVDPPSWEQLRAFLKVNLPSYMIPARFMVLSELPLTVNGKIDRQHLPSPESDRSVTEADYLAPRTSVEEELCQIWADVTGCHPVGISDNFFAIGGDSIRAIQVVSKSEAKGLFFTLQQIFQYQTIDQLSPFVTTKLDQTLVEEISQLKPFELISPNDRLRLPHDCEDAYPITMLQAGMLFHSAYNSEGAVYQDIISRHFRYRFDIAAFEQAFQWLVRRHAILRTSFDFTTFSEPLQLVYSTVDLPLFIIDLKIYTPSEQLAQLEEWLNESKQSKLDWQIAPLFKLYIHLRSDTTFQFSVCFHHSILDGWSVGLLVTELLSFYTSLLEMKTADPAQPQVAISLPAELTTSYRDYVFLEQKVRQSEMARQFWNNRVSKANFIKLPRILPELAAGTASQLAELTLDVPEKIYRTLERLARAQSVPLKTVLLAAHLRVLSLISGRNDVTTGLVFNGRPETGDGERVAGLFLNTLPMYQSLSGTSWIDLINQTFKNEVEMLLYRRYPLAQLQRENEGKTFFEIYFNFVHFHIYKNLLNLPGFEMLDEGALSHEEANYALVVNFVLTIEASDLKIALAYHSDEFTAEQIKNLGESYLQVLETMTENPTSNYRDFNFLSNSEQARLTSWNNTQYDFQAPQTLPDLFTAQVKLTPNAVALIFEEKQLTYHELDQAASLMAAKLQLVGVVPDRLVGVCIDRSFELVICLLAILKVGGAYVPLDPSYPAERLNFMLEDAAVEVLVTTTNLLSCFPTPPTKIVFADKPEAFDQPASSLQPVSLNPDNLAYMIYTSGSTGRPKGAMNTHRGIVNRLLWMQKAYQLTSEDRVLQKTPYSFDVSVWEFFWPLINGAQLVVAKPDGHRDPGYLVKLIASKEITCLHFVPSMLQLFLQVPGVSQLTSLRMIISSGETLSLGLWQLFKAHLGSKANLYNLYGPTEAAVDVTSWDCRKTDHCASVPIGYPIANTSIYLLGSDLQPVPIGGVGELYIGGLNVGRGYYNQPALTAERFIPDAFSSVPGSRLYKTGDLARHGEDGAIDYLGRVDFQVKMRGQRIELGEIETLLSQHEAIKEAVVMLSQQPGGSDKQDSRLIAYFVPTSQPLSNLPHPSNDLEERLRQYLSSKLPAYMVPALFIELTQMPLSPNGKLDRLALPQPSLLNLTPELNYVSPRNELEKTLAEIWGQTLKIEKVGIYDNFFKLGGDSLRSIQISAKAQELGINLTLSNLFAFQTIAALAEAIVANVTIDTPPNNLPGLTTLPFAYISAPDQALLPTHVVDAYPLTQLQFGMIFHSEYTADASTYHDIFSYHLAYHFDEAALNNAVRTLMLLHPVLRTAFVLSGYSEPLQLVFDNVAPPLSVIDISGLEFSAQEEVVVSWLEGEKYHKFELTEAPLFRIYVHLRSATSAQFSLSFHHAILDGWSVASFITKLLELYLFFESESFRAQLPTDFSQPLASSFGDFVGLEQSLLQDSNQQTYWTDKLANFSNISLLPRWSGVRERQTEELRRVKVVTAHLPLELDQALKKVAADSGVPLKTVLLTAHLLVLSLVTAQTTVITGLVSNGRLEEPDGDKVLGLFLNTVPIILELDQVKTWPDLIEQVYKVEEESLPYRRFPLSRIQLLTQRPILFDATFNYTHFHVYQGLPQMPDLQVLGGQFYEETNFALTTNFSLNPLNQQVQLDLNFAQPELSLPQVEVWASYYTHILGLLATNISSPEVIKFDVAQLLPSEERQKLLYAWNDTEALPATLAKTLVTDLFEVQVGYSPEAVAVTDNLITLTYSQLDIQANKLANYLKELGVGPDTLVGILLERQVDMIIALLAVLKAGGAYLPLEMSYSPSRLNWILKDAHPALVLSKIKSESVLQAAGTNSYLLLDELKTKSGIDSCSADKPLVLLEPTNLAYTIYTSGSTGQPKGTLITHAGLVNYLVWSKEAYKGTQGIGAPFHTSLTFDLSVTAVFIPLISGGRLDLLPEEKSLQALSSVLEAQKEYTLVKLTPAHLAVLNHSLNPASLLNSTRVLVIGGEELRSDILAFWTNNASNTRLVNEYGPTETVVGCCIYEYSEFYDSPSPTVPIGRPISNTRLYVLDSQFNPVPVGTAGELYIGGEGVARGYLNRPDLTAEKFMPDPFVLKPGSRIYKTGDLARYRADGNLEFLGRLDHQVKLRGYRIELGEIEVVLNHYPQVQECVVTLNQADLANSATRQLVAYVVPKAGIQNLDLAALRKYLQFTLPEYMVPTIFVPLEKLPVTTNGKVDRNRLPVPVSEQIAGGDIEKAQGQITFSPVQELVAQVWCTLLGVSYIGLDDNLFDLGTHSLLAIQAQARLQSIFAVKFPVHHLFELTTIREQANFLTTQQVVESTDLPLQVVSRNKSIPLSLAQQRLWFLDQLEPGSSLYNICSPVHLSGPLDLQALEQTFNALIQRHEILRTTFSLDPVLEEAVQVIHPYQPQLLVCFDLTDEVEQIAKVQEIISQQQGKPFDLEYDALLRLMVLRLNSNEHVIILTIHHIISDGWSVNVLLQEVSQFYRFFTTGQPHALKELTIQYADYSVWQRQSLVGQRLNTLTSYWQTQLQQTQVLQLPLDNPRSVSITSHGAELNFKISPEVSHRLKALSRQENVTLFMILLAAFDTLLYRQTGQEDLVVGTDVANRLQVETEALIGFFVNILPLRINVKGNPSFLQLLKQVREVLLQAYVHQELPFEKLVEVLKPERVLNHTPIIQALLVLQNTPQAQLEFDQLKVSYFKSNDFTSRFDLALFIEETVGGLVGVWRYKTELFNPETIEQLTNRFLILLEQIVLQPQLRLSEFEILSEKERHLNMLEKANQKEARLQKLLNTKPKAIRISEQRLVEPGFLSSDHSLPLVLQPAKGLEIDLKNWIATNKSYLEEKLLEHGALLFRNFNINTPEQFEQIAATLCYPLFGEYGDLPKAEVGEKIYRSTPYPSEQTILFHNESSHLPTWPARQFFYALQVAEKGGETPIIDCRKVYLALAPATVERFKHKKLMYVRNFTNNLDVSWQDFFHTSDPARVAEICQLEGIEWEWKGNDLQTRQIRPAIIRHPKTKELSFFNQLQLHHPAYLETDLRQSLVNLFTEENLPRQVYYGDGSPIEEEVLAEINDIYRKEQVVFSWQAGDILMLDNMLTAHARNSYQGSRKVLVAMGDMVDDTALIDDK